TSPPVAVPSWNSCRAMSCRQWPSWKNAAATNHSNPSRYPMALISLRQLLDHAAEHGYGVPAFNVNNLEQVRAIMMGADEVNSPVILQASAGARKYAGSNFLRHLILAAIEEFPHVPIVMHQD